LTLPLEGAVRRLAQHYKSTVPHRRMNTTTGLGRGKSGFQKRCYFRGRAGFNALGLKVDHKTILLAAVNDHLFLAATQDAHFDFQIAKAVMPDELVEE